MCPFDPDARDPEELLVSYRDLVCWAEALRKAGAPAVTVVQRFRRDGHLSRNGVDYRFVGDGAPPSVPPWYLGQRVVRTVATACPTVVHVDGLVFPLLVRHLRMRLPRRTAIVAQDHGGIHDGSPGFHRWRWRTLHRLGLRAADGFLFTARELAAPWQRANIMDGGQDIYEVPESSTDLASDIPPADGAGLGLPGQPSLLWVGRLNENKDPLTVLDGFERAAATLPRAALTMVFGTDDLLVSVRQRISSSPVLAKRVHLLGRLDRRRLPALYATADFFVLGSHHESAGFALIEALSFGATPVVTDIPSFRVLTDGGRLGALFPVGDAPSMASALVRLGKATTELASRRAFVRAHFAREFSWPAVGRKALASYQAAAFRRRDVAG